MIRLVAITAMVAAALGAAGGWHVQGLRLGAQLDAQRAEFTATTAAAERSAQEQERKLNATIQEARNAAARRETNYRRDGDALRAELSWLRDETADAVRSLPEVPTVATSSRAATAIKLFEQCAIEYDKMARHAQGHANDALMLQDAWPK